MIDRLLKYVAPHLCSGCQKTGTLLCDNCKYDIISEPFFGCLVCASPTGVRGVCRSCRLPYSRAWCAGERSDTLRVLIDNYKFNRMKASAVVLADILHATIPLLPKDTIIVPIPTIPAHRRERGYDHTLLIASKFGALRQLPVDQNVLRRQTNTVQRLATNRRQRYDQARQAFKVDRALDGNINYLLVDDVMTSGATLHYAAKALKTAGARTIWVAVVARQVSTRDN